MNQKDRRLSIHIVHENGSCGTALRQIDNFAVATSDLTHHTWIIDSLKQGLKEINDKDMIKKYLAANIEQTHKYILVHG